MEKRLLVAAFLSLGVLLLWEWAGPKAPRPAPATVPAVPTRGIAAPPTAAVPVPTPAATTERIAGATEGLTTLENPVARATFSNRGAVLTSFVLLKHFDGQGRPLELVRSVSDPALKPLALSFEGNAELTRAAASALFAVEQSRRALTFRYADDRLSVEKEIRLGDGYLFDVKVKVAGPAYTVLAGTGLRNPTPKELESSYVMPASAVALVGGKIEAIPAPKLKKEEAWPLAANAFVGIEDNYFIAVLAPRQPATARIAPVALPPAAGAPEASKGEPTVSAGVSAAGPLDLRAYFGPKD
ncbi:MAG TPA: membrane protein insertase YidC, partial [Thermoanaerobaculia bacterium]|nr:membrane protein insertase YidC [Thermoanaerobaculia bacterium]